MKRFWEFVIVVTNWPFEGKPFTNGLIVGFPFFVAAMLWRHFNG